MASLVAQSARIWIDTGETVTASAKVVNARMPIIEAAISNPLSANLPELSLMTSEKMEALAQAQRAYWSAFGSFAQLASAQWMDLMGLAMKSRPLAMSDMSRLNDRSVALAQIAMGTGEKVLNPYHRTTTANAKRLERR